MFASAPGARLDASADIDVHIYSQDEIVMNRSKSLFFGIGVSNNVIVEELIPPTVVPVVKFGFSKVVINYLTYVI